MSYWIVLIIGLVIAYGLGKYNQKQGLGFWRTFIMAILMLIGLGAFVIKVIG